MSTFIAKQPNGLYCRFSSVVDTVTEYNMTAEQYVEICANEARIAARKRLDNPEPFSNIVESFSPTNDSIKEFNNILAKMGSEVRLNSDDY